MNIVMQQLNKVQDFLTHKEQSMEQQLFQIELEIENNSSLVSSDNFFGKT